MGGPGEAGGESVVAEPHVAGAREELDVARPHVAYVHYDRLVGVTGFGSGRSARAPGGLARPNGGQRGGQLPRGQARPG